MKGLFGYEIPVTEDDRRRFYREAEIENPMVRAYGKHENPAFRCKDCVYLYYKEYAHRYYKCSLRGDTNGPGTDHRKFWPACAKFKQR